MGYLYCPGCERGDLDEKDFYKDSRNRNGRKSCCKKCYNERRNATRREQLYGISEEEVEALYKQQRRACLVCGEAIEIKKAHLDHSHTTKKVRSLLCSACNLGLGKFKDDPKRLRRAAAYLTAFQTANPDPHGMLVMLRKMGVF